MAKQVCDISGSPGMSRGQSTEHLRDYKNTNPDAKKYGFYDPTRMGLNFEIGRGGVVMPVNRGYPIDKRIKDNMAARGIEMPKPIKMKDGTQKERISVANIILGGSRDRMLQLAFGDQHVDLSKGADNRHVVRQHDIEEWARDQYNLMCRLYGEENIVAFVVHLDEKNPHVHCTVIPVKDGKISYNKFCGGEQRQERQNFFKTAHDAVAAVNAKWGLERGDNINVTGARHRTSEEYLTDLRKQCTRLEEKKGTLLQEVTGLKDSVKQLEGEIRRNEIKLKGLMTMYNNRLTVVGDLERQRQSLVDDVLSGEYNLQETERKKNKLDTQIQSNQDFLERKRREIEETQKLLDQLKKQHSEKLLQVKETDEKLNTLRQEMKELNVEKLDRLEKGLFEDLGRHWYDVAGDWWETLMTKIRPKLSIEGKQFLDKFLNSTIIPELSQNGDEMFRTAAALFLGKEGDAIAIADSVGGGASPSGGWRKKDDEDEDAYRYRCISTATMMIRKSKKTPKIRGGIHF